MTKKFIFAIQGEGRGHLTQAIALFRSLKEQGHTISCVIVGRSPEREIPEFFLRKINVPVVQVQSPNFVLDKQGRSINITKSVTHNFFQRHVFHESLKRIKQVVDQFQPDIVVNFYEPLIGLYALRYKHTFKIISIAHQYIYLHGKFRFPHGFPIQSRILKWYTKLTSIGSHKILALSMYDLGPSGNRTLLMTPPALRYELNTLKSQTEDFILVYLVNSGFMKDIISWHKKHPDTKLICFTDSRDVRERYKGTYKFDETLVFHSLDDEKFLNLMARCKAMVCTAGFESICEAMYLRKPVMLVPVKGHFEQFCNARDAERIGAGIYAEEFNLDHLDSKLLFYSNNNNDQYKQWVNSFMAKFTEAIDSLNTSTAIHMATT